jgi:hypothetical protein
MTDGAHALDNARISKAWAEQRRQDARWNLPGIGRNWTDREDDSQNWLAVLPAKNLRPKGT